MSRINYQTARKVSITTPSDTEIHIETMINAPRDLIYQAYVDPKAIPHWWGPARLRTVVEEMDVKVGGKWKYLQYEPDGTEYVFHGEYKEVDRPNKITWTFNFGMWEGRESTETVEFVEVEPRKTKIINTVVYQSKEDRDGMLQSGMESGMSESLDRLEVLVWEYAKKQKIKACLWFDGEAEEAVNFYTTIFEKAEILSIQRYGKGSPFSEGTAMTIQFRLQGQDFMALNGGSQHKFTPAISMYVNCKDQKEVDHLWDNLTEGGEESMCGWLVDKYGVSWQIVPTGLGNLLSNPEKAGKVMEALMPMKKIDLDILQQAYDQ